MNYFKYFYHYLGISLILSMLLSVSVGFFDGLGLALFMPLLKVIDGPVSIDPNDPLFFISKIFSAFNLDLDLTSILIFITILFLLKGISNFISKSYRIILRQRFIKELRIALVNNLSAISYRAFVKSEVGRMQNSMTNEIEKCLSACLIFLSTLEYLILVFVYLGFSLYIDFYFTIFAIFAGIFNYLIFNVIYKQTKTGSQQIVRGFNDFQGLVLELINNFKYLKSTGSIKIFRKKINKMVDLIELSKRRIFINDALMQSSPEPILIFIVVIIILAYTKLFQASIDSVLVSLLLFYRAATSIMNMQVSYNKFLAFSASIDNIILFNDELQSERESIGYTTINGFNNEIQIIEGSIYYDNEEMIKKVNLKIKKNETIAIVGESGSGKTTLLNLLSTLIPLDKGKMLIDGVDSTLIDRNSFRKQIGYITQEPVIFSDSVFNNITSWSEKSDANIKKFKSVLKNALIYDFVESLPEKFDTTLGHNGVNISGGQRQRISIARELFKNVNIFMFDEATSNLDSNIEKSIQENIDNLKRDHTMLIVAHRLSTIKNADKIILLKNGRIQSVGNYKSLLESDSDFKKMINNQQLN